MSRLTVWMLCVGLLNGISGCACCCSPPTGCCATGAAYQLPYGEDWGYESVADYGYDAGSCGCSSGDPYGSYGSYGSDYQGVPIVSQQYRSNPAYANYAHGAANPRYNYYNPSPKLAQQVQQRPRRTAVTNQASGQIQQTSMSVPEPWNSDFRGNALPTGQRPAACNCGR